MRRRTLATLLGLVVAMLATTVNTPVRATVQDEYSGPYFGAGNLPPGCIADMEVSPENICHHLRTDLNGLDSPQVDVLVLLPVTPTVERDMRIMRQAVEMWEGGIDTLSPQMGLDWLGQGVDFHITVDAFDPTGNDGGEFTTYPIVDPEIVVIGTTNPFGALGIGIDPVDFGATVEDIATGGDPLVFTSEDRVPCHTVQNPFDFSYWENLPGFDSHHDSRSGIYNEDCGGAGGNICFAVNTVLDPAPDVIEIVSMFDIVAHEFGHCMTIGHVGDGAEGGWGVVPTNDIMSYNPDPPGRTKCVSTLDVEGVALRMSKYLDVNGDAAVNGADLLHANDPVGDGFDPFQVQHPDDHLYASSTGAPGDCPQPDLSVVPGGPRTDWTPAPAAVVDPTSSSGSYVDADDDARSSITEILAFDVEVTATHVDATIDLADLWPSKSVASGTSYSLSIDGRRFDSFIRYAVDANPMTWDNGAGAYMPAGTSSWDLNAKTVSFHIPRSYLDAGGITSPYFLTSQANFGLLSSAVVDDRAPEAGATIGVAG